MSNEFDSISVDVDGESTSVAAVVGAVDFDPDAAAEAARAKAEQLRAEIAGLKVDRTEITARITSKGEELKKVERFISASTPRTRKAKS